METKKKLCDFYFLYLNFSVWAVGRTLAEGYDTQSFNDILL